VELKHALARRHHLGRDFDFLTGRASFRRDIAA
jgi:hypothetical protein